MPFLSCTYNTHDMIGIGINEDCYLGEPKKNEKHTLEVTFKQLAGDPAAAAELKKKLEDNPFADWDEGGYSDDGEGVKLTLRVFPFDSNPPQSDPTKVIDATAMKERIDTVRAPLYHILDYFYPGKDKNGVALNPLNTKAVFNKTGIEGANFGTKIMDETVQEKVYANIVDTFITAVTPFVDATDNLFRLKLARQSKAKAFATLPSRFLKDSPFIESMKIPVASSKLKFSAWEKTNGFDKADPISDTTADKAGQKKGGAKEELTEDPFAV